MISSAFLEFTYFTKAVPLEVFVNLSTTTFAHFTFPYLAKNSFRVASFTLAGKFLTNTVLDKSYYALCSYFTGSSCLTSFFSSFNSYSLSSAFTSSSTIGSSSSSLTLSAINLFFEIEKSMIIGLPLNLL